MAKFDFYGFNAIDFAGRGRGDRGRGDRGRGDRDRSLVVVSR